jgi:hypothetical protein
MHAEAIGRESFQLAPPRRRRADAWWSPIGAAISDELGHFRGGGLGPLTGSVRLNCGVIVGFKSVDYGNQLCLRRRACRQATDLL